MHLHAWLLVLAQGRELHETQVTFSREGIVSCRVRVECNILHGLHGAAHTL